jgi:hypothetical protein
MPDQAYVSPEAAVLTRLAVRLLSDDLNAMAYDAELAGLGWSAGSTTEGLLVTFYGWGCPRSACVLDNPVLPERRHAFSIWEEHCLGKMVGLERARGQVASQCHFLALTCYVLACCSKQPAAMF